MKIELRDIDGVVACKNCGVLIVENRANEYDAPRDDQYYELGIVYFCQNCWDSEGKRPI